MVKHTVYLGSYTSGKGPNPQTNYVSNMVEGFGPSTSEGIYSATFDDSDGALSNLELAAEVYISPAWLQWHPALPVLYSANSTFDNSPSAVTGFRVTPSFGLERLSSVSTGGGSAAHAAVHHSGKWLAVAHHGLPPTHTVGKSGSVAIVSLAADGTPLEQVALVIHPTETDPKLLADPGRSDWTSHAHSVNYDSTGKWLFVCEKGLDRVYVYTFDEATGTIAHHSECMTPIGNAARHLAVHPNGKHIYVDEEAGAMVTTHDFDSATGVLTRTQTMTTLRAGDEASTSECELSPDASTLYVANRAGDDSTIATFAVSPADGSLTPKGHQLCGNHPRFFQVDPSGKWLLVNALVDKAVNVLPLDTEGVPTSGPVSSLDCGFPASHVLFLDPARLAGAAL